METFFNYLFKAQLLRDTETKAQSAWASILNLVSGCFRDTLYESVTGIIECISLLELGLYVNAFVPPPVHNLLVNCKTPLLS